MFKKEFPYKSVGAIGWAVYPLVRQIENIAESKAVSLNGIVFALVWVFLSFGLLKEWKWSRYTVISISCVGIFALFINAVFNVNPEVEWQRSVLLIFYFLFVLTCILIPKGFKVHYKFITNASTLAMVSLIFGGFAFLNILANKSLIIAFLFGVPASIFGWISLKKLSENNYGYREGHFNSRNAWIGIIAGFFSSFGAILVWTINGFE